LTVNFNYRALLWLAGALVIVACGWTEPSLSWTVLLHPRGLLALLAAGFAALTKEA
jgi:hypothetical protein